jgi:hypothetical protein
MDGPLFIFRMSLNAGERHIVGMLERSRLIVAVVYTIREGRRRIITAHPAPEKQRAAFNAHNGIV